LPVPNFPVPIAPNNPITYLPGTYPQPTPLFNTEVNGVIGDMSSSMAMLPQLEALAQQQLSQQAIQQNYSQQSQASLTAYNNIVPFRPSPSMPTSPTQNQPSANTQAPSSGSLANVDYSKLPKDSVEGVKKYGAMIAAAEKKYGIPPGLLFGLIRQESKFNATIGSSAGAKGLGQLMPETAKSLGVTDVNDPAQNIEGSAKYLAQRLKDFNGDVTLALAAYNAGIGNVKKHGGVPPFKQTQHYVKVVQENQKLFQNAGIA
jgi:soluble lytic murein transglycosylase-like protein